MNYKTTISGTLNTSQNLVFPFFSNEEKRGSVEYVFGFNGMEKDDEIAGTGNSYTAEFWQYDSRLGRRWNNDPVVKEWESSYAAFANNPIWFVDPMGNDTSFADNKTKDQINETYNNAKNKINELDNQLKGLDKNKNKEEYQNILNQKNELCDILNDFDNIINSKQMFFYRGIENPEKAKRGGKTSYDEENKRYEIQFKFGNSHTIVHENKHGNQHLDGRLKYYDYMDEVEAFQKGEDFRQFIKNDKDIMNDAQIKNYVIKEYSKNKTINKEFIQQRSIVNYLKVDAFNILDINK